MSDQLALIHRILSERNQMLATAESLTAGDLAAHITSIPGASQIFMGGVITYATSLKRDLLGVRASRVISAECATQMAQGVRRLTGATWGLSTTGVAGPGSVEDQPVGTVFVGLSSPLGTRAEPLRLDFPQGPEQRSLIRAAVCAAAIQLLHDQLIGGQD